MSESIWSPCELTPRMGTEVRSYFCGIFQWCNKWFFPRNLCTPTSRWSEKDVWNWGGLGTNCCQGFHMYVFKPAAMQLCKYFVSLFSLWQIKQCKAKQWACRNQYQLSPDVSKTPIPRERSPAQDTSPQHFLGRPFPSHPQIPCHYTITLITPITPQSRCVSAFHLCHQGPHTLLLSTAPTHQAPTHEYTASF